MKKYVYILLLLASVSTLATAEIKIEVYFLKTGGEYAGELKGRKPNGKGKKNNLQRERKYEGEYIKSKHGRQDIYVSGQWFYGLITRQLEPSNFMNNNDEGNIGLQTISKEQKHIC